MQTKRTNQILFIRERFESDWMYLKFPRKVLILLLRLRDFPNICVSKFRERTKSFIIHYRRQFHLKFVIKIFAQLYHWLRHVTRVVHLQDLSISLWIPGTEFFLRQLLKLLLMQTLFIKSIRWRFLKGRKSILIVFSLLLSTVTIFRTWLFLNKSASKVSMLLFDMRNLWNIGAWFRRYVGSFLILLASMNRSTKSPRS